MTDYPTRSAEILDRGPAIIARFTDNIGKGETRLVAPACAKGCSPCYRECALRELHARLWARRLAELQADTVEQDN